MTQGQDMNKKDPDLQLRGLRRRLRRLRARLKELEELALDFKRYAQHEDSCGIFDGRGVCSCGLQRVLDKL